MMMGRTFKRLLADKRGNFAILTALGLPLLFGAVGAGMETTRVMQVKNDMQTVLDSATLAVATHARIDEGKKSDAEYAAEVRQRLENYGVDDDDDASASGNGKGNGNGNGNGADKGKSKKKKPEVDAIAERSDNKKGTAFKISGTISRQVELNPLMGFLGFQTITLRVSSTAQSSFSKGAALSLYLVLDRSGSMSFKTDTVNKSKDTCSNYSEKSWPRAESNKPCYVSKMQSLQEAVSYLMDTLNKSDPSYKDHGNPESELVRTGAIAYNDVPFAARQLSWGTSSARSYVNAIPQYPTGGTNAAVALNTAFTALKSSNSNEKREHDKNGNNAFQRYVVLMTDGEMTSTAIDNQVRSTCAAVKADGIQIFTVAFMAPAKGKSLLQYCASSADNYYDPNNMEEIVAAFGEIARKAASLPTRLIN